MTIRRVAILTAGGYAPCLSSAVAGLIERYTELSPETEIIAYRYGYRGLLLGDSITVTPEARKQTHILHFFGGSPIGNSRVKLTNTEDLLRRGLVHEGENALEVAAKQLQKDGVDVLHTIGGDDTSTTAADLAAYLEDNGYSLTVVGLPKTIDNDIVPVAQSMGAWTAAEEAAHFAEHIIAEHNSTPRVLIIHEVMGRNCGYLTAEAASEYHNWVGRQTWAPLLGLTPETWDVHAVYLPEMTIDFATEAKRLRGIMDRLGNVNIFLSEGAGVDEIVAHMRATGQEVPIDAFGHVKLDKINPGEWFASQFASRLGAEKTLVQKSGYFSRSAPASDRDLVLIKGMVDFAVDAAMRGESGLVGHDEENGNLLSCIAFPRVAGHKPFNINRSWFRKLLGEIGQIEDGSAQGDGAK